MPIAHRPDCLLGYDNLLYACAACNLLKGDQSVPDPLRVFTSESVVVKPNGTLQGKSKDARRLIDLLQLNGASYRQRRRLMLAILKAIGKANPELKEEVLSFRDDLPDLSSLKPPGGNTRPSGVKKSYHALRLAGKLPKAY